MGEILCTAQIGGDGRPVLRSTYVSALAEHGGTAIILTPEDTEAERERCLARVKGILLTGGGDVDPRLYGRSDRRNCREVSSARDCFEMGLCRAAIERGIPLLAICRGIQVLNVALGGTLCADLSDHMDTVHTIRTDPASPLFPLLSAECRVNSFHHQGIGRLAGALRIASLAPDGCPEAVWLPGHRFCIGVQWHPERMREKRGQDALFACFLGET